MTRSGGYLCQACGHVTSKWLGRCPECGAWGSLSETAEPAPRGRRSGQKGARARVQPLAEVAREAVARFSSGLPLLDRVLGGGVVAGGVVLLAGEPGIGKSTLLLQVADALGREGLTTLYVSAESPRQLRLRASGSAARKGRAGRRRDRSRRVLGAVEERAPGSSSSTRSRRCAAPGKPAGTVSQVAIAPTGSPNNNAPGWRSSSSATSPRRGDRGRSRSSISSTPCSPSKGITASTPPAGDEEPVRPDRRVALFEMHDNGLAALTDPPGPARPAPQRARLGGRRLLRVAAAARQVQALVAPTSFPRRMAVGLEGGRVVLLVAVLA